MTKKILKKGVPEKNKVRKEPYKVEGKKNLNQRGKKILYGKIPYRRSTEKFYITEKGKGGEVPGKRKKT